MPQHRRTLRPVSSAGAATPARVLPPPRAACHRSRRIWQGAQVLLVRTAGAEAACARCLLRGLIKPVRSCYDCCAGNDD